MKQQFIVIEGKTYKSVDEMPPDVRKKYEAAIRNLDKNQNGIPDLLETTNPSADKDNEQMENIFQNMSPTSSVNYTSSTKILINGQSYDSTDQLPPEIQAKYQKAMAKLANRTQMFPDLDQLPPDKRAKVQQALERLDANKNGIPDFAEAIMASQNQAMGQNNPMDAALSAPLPSKPKPASSMPGSSAIEPESASKWLWIVLGIVFVGSCLVLLAVGAWYYFLK